MCGCVHVCTFRPQGHPGGHRGRVAWGTFFSTSSPVLSPTQRLSGQGPGEGTVALRAAAPMCLCSGSRLTSCSPEGTPEPGSPAAGSSQHSGVAAGEPGRFLGLNVPHGHLVEAAWAAPDQQPEFASWASSRRREEKAEREQLPCGRAHPPFYGWPCQARARKAGAISPKGAATAPRAPGVPESGRETRPSGSAVPLREPSGQPPPLGCRLIPARACSWQDLIPPSGAGSAGRAQKCPPRPAS